jgi:Leucine-rich repeat (LRR) protein
MSTPFLVLYCLGGLDATLNTRISPKNQQIDPFEGPFINYNMYIFHISYKEFNMRRRIISVIIALLLLLGSSQASSVLAWTPQESNTQPVDLQETSQTEAYDEPIERPEYEPPSEESLRLTEEQVQAFDCGTVTDVPRVECEALLALYQSTNGSAWKNNTNWLQSTTVGNWHGVSLKSGQVLNIVLINNNLDGTLPEAIGSFANLEYLTLNNNNLRGKIPSSIGQLKKLNRLHLDTNQLSDAIPPEMGDLEDLVHLDLSTNALSGSIPGSLGKLKNLESLNLINNKLSGSIPSTIGGMTKLRILNLSINQLSGTIPAELGQLIELEKLNLQTNNFFGRIPSEFGNLVKLKGLNLSSNTFRGDLPVSITKLVNLCGGTDNPAGCGQWDKTDFGFNYFNVPQPEPQNSFLNIKDPDWAQSQKEHFDCRPVTGVPVSECEALVDFYYGTNGKEWYDKENWLQTTNIGSWYGVSTIYGHVGILYFEENNLQGELPESLADLTGLNILNLINNQIGGNIPKSLGSLSNLTDLVLSINQFSGPIPSELGNLSELTLLSLAANQLTGEIPPELGNLSKLEALSLSYNQLAGFIPEQLGHLAKLRDLWLNDNQLMGRIPAKLGQLSNLEHLEINANRLYGVVPESFGSLTKLRHLWLDENYLSGDMPDSITNLVNLCGGTDNPADCKLWQKTDFGHNCFNVPQPEPQNSFMTTKDPDWAETQRTCEIGLLNFPIVLRP